MAADYVIVSGDTEPLFSDSLEYSNGQPVNLEGATVTFIMRSLTANEPVRLTGTVGYTNRAEGKLYYQPTALDTATVGNYLASWHVVFAGGETQTFPTEGYLQVAVTRSLSSKTSPQLIGLPELLDELQGPANDRIHDAKLERWIEAVAPLIENLTGPIIPTVYDEWYAGGHTTISLRHRPNAGYGTKPLLNVLSVVEYRGPIAYDLLNVMNPSAGSVYSILVNKQLGYIARRTSGGGEEPFWGSSGHAAQNVRVRYVAGQEEVPALVREAAVETLKWKWESTQPIGKGLMSGSVQSNEGGRPLVALPFHVEALLAPITKGPGIA